MARADDVVVRHLSVGDIPDAQEVSYSALREAGTRYGWVMPELDDAGRARGLRRLEHCLAHDPDGAFVAVRDGEILGVGLATRRGPLWFLSLLAVGTTMQGQGVGRRLLEATLSTLDGAGAICASDDPKALRRYHAAGFSLLPAYEAKGTLDRTVLPPVGDVRAVSWDAHRDLVEAVASRQRGAPHGPDLDFYAAAGAALHVIDGPAGRGYVVSRESGPVLLGATSPDAARRLLWTALAEAGAEEREVGWMSHEQQWALDVVMAARLSVRPTGSSCVTGAVGPRWPYLPNGGLG